MTAPISATLYAADGSTSVVALTNSSARQWLDELNATGSGSLRLPIADSAVASCGYNQVVKLSYEGSARFAFLVEGMEWDVVLEAGSRFLVLSGRGLLAWLEAALLLPYGGMSFSSADQRVFNFASADSPSHDLHATWGTPVGVKWTARSDGQAGYPIDWPDIDAYYIWSTDPQSATPAGTVNWFRKQFTLSADADLRLFVSGDDFFDVYVDGELVYSVATLGSWQKVGTADFSLAAGTHVIAMRGENATRPNPLTNVADVLASLVTLDINGQPDVTVTHTDTSWQVATTEPYWTAGDVLHTVVAEAQAFGWGHLSALTLDFTSSTDSNGAAWTTKVSRSWPIVTTNLLTLASDLAELGIDVWMTPDRVLHAAETRGSAKSVTLSSAANTQSWRIKGRRATGTFGWVRTELGWVEVQDAAGVAAQGRIGIGLQTGNSDSDATAGQVAAAAFATSAAASETVTDASLVPVTGAKPYVDYGVADTVTGISKTGGAMSARFLSLTLSEDDAGTVTVQPELEAS